MKFVSFRRSLLDRELNLAVGKFQGKILDLGGRKEGRRGFFKVPEHLKPDWMVLNNDIKAEPEILATLPRIPLEDESVDTIIMTEVIEYIFDYEALVSEIQRVLKRDGHIFISAPFLHPFHGDFQSDYFRFTESFFEKVFHSKFEIVTKKRMGGISLVIGDLLLNYFSHKKTFVGVMIVKLIRLLSPLLIFTDKHCFKRNFFIHTGFWLNLKVRKS